MQTDLFLRSIALGAATGLRTMTGPSALFRRTGWRNAWWALALGEYLVDKLPQTPARTGVGPLVARVVAGGLCGTVVALRAKANPVAFAVTGGAAAFGAAHVGLAWREHSPAWLPKPVAALLEDAVAVSLAKSGTRPVR